LYKVLKGLTIFQFTARYKAAITQLTEVSAEIEINVEING